MTFTELGMVTEINVLHSANASSAISVMVSLITAWAPQLLQSTHSTTALGFDVGVMEGEEVGEGVGIAVGLDVGVMDGEAVGEGVGVAVGFDVGVTDGEVVGEGVGEAVGFTDGVTDGEYVGDTVGCAVGANVENVTTGAVNDGATRILMFANLARVVFAVLRRNCPEVTADCNSVVTSSYRTVT